MEIQYDSNGDGWEIDAPYEFSSNGEEWSKGLLEDVDNEGIPYYANGIWYMYIRTCQTPVVSGKIHKKTVELVEGEYYKFDYGVGMTAVGQYRPREKSADGFSVFGYEFINIHDCTNIERMVEVEEPLVSLPVNGDEWKSMVNYICSHKSDIEEGINDFDCLKPMLDYFNRNS